MRIQGLWAKGYGLWVESGALVSRRYALIITSTGTLWSRDCGVRAQVWLVPSTKTVVSRDLRHRNQEWSLGLHPKPQTRHRCRNHLKNENTQSSVGFGGCKELANIGPQGSFLQLDCKVP